MRPSIAIVIISVALIIGLQALGWLQPVEDGLRAALARPARLAYQLSARPDADGAPRALEESRLKLLEQANQELRAQLNFLQTRAYRTIGADVIGKSTDPLRQTRWINRGAADGVAAGQPVVVHDGVLAGKVIAVEDKQSLVQLLTDHQSRVAATVTNREQSLGIIEGGYGLSIRMNFIPQNETVPVGEMVITSGLEPKIPRGLVIGVIETVEKEAYQPFQQASITPLAKGDKIWSVSIILDAPSSADSL